MDMNIYEDAISGIHSILMELEVDDGRIGIEENYIPFKTYKRISNSLPYAKLIDAQEFLAELRIIKTEEEIKRVRKVVKISERALMKAYEAAGVGITELEVEKVLKTSLVKDGAC